MSTFQRRNATQRGFTLIELLVVIAIILLLAGLLLPAVAMARKHARVMAARSEVKNIEAAWKQYYTEYERWPSFVDDETPYCMSGSVARIVVTGASSAENPKQLRFLDFKRLNESRSPVVPWADISLDDDETWAASDPEDGAHFYWVKFDAEYDNTLDEDDDDPGYLETPLTNDLRRTVIVWTANPDIDPGDPEYIIGSWQ